MASKLLQVGNWVSTKLPIEARRTAITKPWLVMRVFQGDSYISRVPEHYKKFYYEWKIVPPSPVHYVPESGNFKKLRDGQVVQVQHIPLLLVQPKELHQGIWGGEAIIKGFTKKKNVRRAPRYWVPDLQKTVLYSEILDRYMNLTVTERTLKLVDEHFGFDSYILKTPPNDLMSELALRLKREMLLALVRETLYPEDPAMKEKILKKYSDYIIPEEEAAWYGLTIKEAATKQKKIEEEESKPGPLKYAFRREFIQYLEDNKDQLDEAAAVEAKSTSSSSWLSSVNPFAKK